MKLEEFRTYLYENEPEEEMVRGFIINNPNTDYGFLANIYNILDLNQGGKYQGVNKLKLLIMLYNMIEEISYMDLVVPPKYPQHTSQYYTRISTVISKVFARVSTAVKYKKHNHFLNIEYKAVLKEKPNAKS